MSRNAVRGDDLPVEPWDEGTWENLLASIESRTVIPIIGPDLLPIVVNGETILLQEYLAQRLAEAFAKALSKGHHSLRPNSSGRLRLSDVVSAIIAVGTPRYHISRAIQSLLTETAIATPEPLRQLALISHFNLYVTTTFDPLLENALNSIRFGNRDQTLSVDYSPKQTDEKKDIGPGNIGFPTVFHLMGKLAPGSKCVLTDEDLLEVICKLQVKTFVPRNLFGQLRENNLLILGQDFSDWLTRIFLRTTRPDRLSITRDFIEVLANRRKYFDTDLVVFLQHFSPPTRVFLEGEGVEFVNQLWRRWCKRNPHLIPDPREPEIPPAAVMPDGAIFLSYATEDAPAVRKLKAGLDAGGLDAWYDVERIKGGQPVEVEIKECISRKCACFVPLMSKNTERRLRGYFRAEWNLAVARDQESDPSLSFIVPVIIDGINAKDLKHVDGNRRFLDLHAVHLDGGRVNADFIARLKEIVGRAVAPGRAEDSADVTGPRTEAVTEELHLQNPWPGIAPYIEESQDFFFGRFRETLDLLELIERNAIGILYGRSGLGKTSLLSAGLSPKLREKGLFPVVIRLLFTETAPQLIDQVKSELSSALTEASVPDTCFPRTRESLWEFFHRAADPPSHRDGTALRPVLIFDQFEESFVFGRRNSASRRRLNTFFSELGDLVENRIPTDIELRLKNEQGLDSRFVFEKANCPVVLALQEEYLAELDGLQSLIPSIADSRLRLTAFNGDQAYEAVIKPGRAVVSVAVARDIVSFVAGDGATFDPEHFSSLEVEPFLLSLVCSELNNKRLAKGLGQITRDLLVGNSQGILEEFCNRCFEALPVEIRSEVRSFVEDELVGTDGSRLDMPLEHASRAIRERGVPESAINQLAKRRLLHIDRRLGVERVELIHNVLAQALKKSREDRLKSRELESMQRTRDELTELRERESMQQRQNLIRLGFGGIVGAIAACLALLLENHVIGNAWTTEHVTSSPAKAESDSKSERLVEEAFRLSTIDGDNLCKMNKLDEAIGPYGQALALKPDDFSARNNLFYALIHAQRDVAINRGRAIVIAEETVRLLHRGSIEWAATQRSLGDTCLNLPNGRVEVLNKAIVAYEEALTVYTKEKHPSERTSVESSIMSAKQRLQSDKTVH